jgi:PAS domain S-box-containing protein
MADGNSNIPHFLSGPGEMTRLIREYDWSNTSVGPMDKWPQSLKTTLNTVLKSKFPMLLWWGEDLIQFYNDTYRIMLGDNGKHPAALGQKGKEGWAETWSILQPLIDYVISENESIFNENQFVPIYRNGVMEEAYWTFSYSPVSDDNGNTGGVLVVTMETTKYVNSIDRIKRSEERFQNLVREATVGIIVMTGEEMKVEIVNEFYGRLINHTTEELLGHPLFDIIPEAADPFLAILNNVRTSGIPVYLYDQAYFVYSEGRKKEGYVNLVYQPYKDSNGTIIGVMALCHDVTEQVNTRQKVETSELFAKTVINKSEAAQAVWLGENMVFDMANEKMLEMLGRDNSIIGKPFMEAIPELKKTPLLERLLNVLETGETYYQPEEMFVLMRHGKPHTGYYNYSYAVLTNPAGQNYGIICTATDVTEQVVNRQKIEQAEAKARLAIDSASLGTYEIDYATDVMLTSDRFNEIWGIPHGLTRNEIVTRIHPDDIPARQKSHNESLTTGNLHYEARIVWDDQTEHWVRVKGKVVYDEKGKPATLLGVVQDINEQRLSAERLAEMIKIAEDKIKQYTHELEFQNEELKQFAFVASHDMKEPLRKVIFNNTFLNERIHDRLDDKEKTALQRSTDGAKRMQTLIDDILSYSQTAFADHTKEKVDLNVTIQNVIDNLKEVIEEEGAVIELPVMPVINGIPHQLSQLFDNLLNNAIKYRHPDRKPVITITSQIIRDSELNKDQTPRAYHKISMADNGIGFKDSNAEKIFDLFYRLNDRKQYSGTGIGLSICRKIAQNHNGFIQAHGHPEKGAQFDIYLPVEGK